jgi:hypothetical protein
MAMIATFTAMSFFLLTDMPLLNFSRLFINDCSTAIAFMKRLLRFLTKENRYDDHSGYKDYH